MQVATFVLAFCNMRTLYLRNVPDDVAERLERLASRAGMSVSSLAVRELGQISQRADNPSLLGLLPDLDVPTEAIVADIDTGRAAR